jgi:hypothetical protein
VDKNPTPDAVGKRGTDPLQHVQIHRCRRYHDKYVNSSVLPVQQRWLNHSARQEPTSSSGEVQRARKSRCAYDGATMPR